MNRDLINRARDFAHASHDSVKQIRKYTGEPYWNHTDAVALIVEAHDGTPDMIAAAHLHDVLEDVEPVLIKEGRVAELQNFRFVYYNFPASVRDMVVELTHLYTQEDFPDWGRARRKQAEAERLWSVSNNSKTIKAADLMQNTESIVLHDPGFAITYLKEKHEVLKGLTGAHPGLLIKVRKQLAESLDKLNVIV